MFIEPVPDGFKRNAPLISFDSENNLVYDYEFSGEKDFIYKTMLQLYYWSDSIGPVNYEDYETPVDLYYSLRDYKDNWSYATSLIENEQYWEEGTEYGYGINVEFNYDGQLRVTEVYPQSDLYAAGVRRGARVVSINGDSHFYLNDRDALWSVFYDSSLSSHTFVFDQNNAVIDGTFTKGHVAYETIYSLKTFTAGSNKVGYFAYTGFNSVQYEQLSEALFQLQDEGIDDLIIDLRNNGGGEVSMAGYILDMLIGEDYDQQVIFDWRYNQLYSHWNRTSVLDNPTVYGAGSFNLDLNRVFFLTTRNSASASELLINSAKPYIDVYCVGDVTHGKTVGMFGVDYGPTLYVPVSFAIYNAAGEGGFFEGLKPDSWILDNLEYDYGDENDPIIAETLNYIATGNFTYPSYTDAVEGGASRRGVGKITLNYNDRGLIQNFRKLK